MTDTVASRWSRRRFLHAVGGAGAAAMLGPVVAARGAPETVVTDGAPADPLATSASRPAIVPFEGAHQAGIERPSVSQAATLVAAFDVMAPGRAALRDLLVELTGRSRELADARPPMPRDPSYPPPESGILGSSIGPADLTLTVSVGASLFDDRFGLRDRRPRQLAPMPVFPNDQLDDAEVHGDLLVTVCATDAPACLHALRYLMLGARSHIALRWMIEGFQRPDTQSGAGRTATRNLLGFKDGTSNLLPGSEELGERVWVAAGDPEPAWTIGGSYQVVRIIRMFVERWDRTALDEQQAIMGRTKRTGSPLGGAREEDPPVFTDDPAGARIPLDAHIRLANPRTPETATSRILRRGYSFSRGFDRAGQLDQGLLFVCYQRDLAAGFEAVQRRLDGEPLEEYIRPVGGSYFFALPGVSTPGSFLGEGLLA